MDEAAMPQPGTAACRVQINMATLPNLDWVLGGLAIAILLGGLWLLLSGVSSMGD